MNTEPRKRAQLLTGDAIWNEVLDFASQIHFPVNEEFINDLSILVQYYNEMESGGHEGLLNWTVGPISNFGFENYIQSLTNTLQTIGAKDIAVIEQQYAPLYWPLYHQLERNEIDEELFYEVIEKADKAYYEHSETLRTLLEQYFISIYTELFEIID